MADIAPHVLKRTERQNRRVSISVGDVRERNWSVGFLFAMNAGALRGAHSTTSVVRSGSVTDAPHGKHKGNAPSVAGTVRTRNGDGAMRAEQKREPDYVIDGVSLHAGAFTSRRLSGRMSVVTQNGSFSLIRSGERRSTL